MLLPERANSTMVEKDVSLTYPREKLSSQNMTLTYDLFIVSKQHTNMELACKNSKRGARVDDEHKITKNSD